MPSLDRLLSRLAPAPVGRPPELRDRLRVMVRAGVVLTVAASAALALPYYVRAIDRLGDRASVNAAANYDDRELGGGSAVVPEGQPLFEARARIPADETYRIVPGPRVEDATDLTEQYVDQFARFFLMPRRPAPDAPWVLCYGCDPAELEDGLVRVWESPAGVSLWRRPP